MSVFLKREEAVRATQAMTGKVLDATECEELGFVGFGAGAFYEESMAIDPSQLFDQLRRLLMERGVSFRLGQKASIQTSGNVVSSVLVENENVTGDVYIATGGSETTELLNDTGFDSRILPALGLAMLFNTHGEKIIGYPADIDDYGIGLNQHNQNVLRVTSFMDLVGFNKGIAGQEKNGYLGF